MANDRKTQYGWAPTAQQPQSQPVNPNAGPFDGDTAPTGRYTPSRGTPAYPQQQQTVYSQQQQTWGSPPPMPSDAPSVDAQYQVQAQQQASIDQQHAQAAAMYGAAYANAAYPQATAARNAGAAMVQQPQANPSVDEQHAQAAAMYGVDYANAAYPTATAAMTAAYARAYPASSPAPYSAAPSPSGATATGASGYPSAAPYVGSPAPAPAPTAAPAHAVTPTPFADPDDSASDLRERANATVGVSDRVRFIRLTYLHLLFAILTFAGLEYVVQTTPVLVEKFVMPFTNWALTGRNWGIVLAAFMAVSWVADRYAKHSKSRAAQYFGLLLYVCAEVAIFVPLLAIVQFYTQDMLASGGGDPHILRDAGFTTVGVFLVLTLVVVLSKKDFSFLRGGLAAASGAALALIAMSILWGFSLGLAFCVGMVLVASGYILFNTSRVLAHYDTRAHVAAALALFSSLALLFWYVIQIFMDMRSND